MKTPIALSTFVLSFFAIVLLGCAGEEPPPKKSAQPDEPKSKVKKVGLGKNIFLEIQGEDRRVLIEAYVCMRKGQLEQFLTRKQTKEHEAILAAEIDARELHAALIAAGAEQGKPTQFRPAFKPPTGTEIKITIEYEEKGKKVRVPANEWIRNAKSKKNLDLNWVFAGSYLIPDPEDKSKKPFYAANDGDVICLSNFETALLDLPINSSKDNDDLVFEAHTERIPEQGTQVLVILEPVLNKKKK